MRAFVAVEVARSDRATGVTSAPEHLTLRFLGEIAPTDVPRASAALTPVAARFAPFEITLEGVGAFPSSAQPRVVWQGVERGRAELEALANAVREALAPAFGVEPGRFVAHLTLFRVRSPGDRRAARELLDGQRTPPPARTAWVREFVLKESVLGPGGAVHRAVAAFPLGGGSPT
jgi:2'-5' RNA ligase